MAFWNDSHKDAVSGFMMAEAAMLERQLKLSKDFRRIGKRRDPATAARILFWTTHGIALQHIVRSESKEALRALDRLPTLIEI